MLTLHDDKLPNWFAATCFVDVPPLLMRLDVMAQLNAGNSEAVRFWQAAVTDAWHLLCCRR